MTGDVPAVFVQYAARLPGTPTAAFFERCVHEVFAGCAGELVVRVVGESESAMLNERYRGKQGATNVLAFPPGELPELVGEPAPLGDIVICAPVVAREAGRQGKPLDVHWGHMVVHGCLHLRGFDHMNDREAREMEARERELLAALGLADADAADAG